TVAQAPIAARKTTYPTVPASAATPSFSVRPIATPMANSSGRFPKTAPPAAAMTCETISGSHEKLALPTPSRMPATGSTETGNIMHLPIFWRTENALLKIVMGVDGCSGRSGVLRGNHSPDFLRGAGGKGTPGEFTTGFHIQGTDLRLHRRYRRQAD